VRGTSVAELEGVRPFASALLLPAFAATLGLARPASAADPRLELEGGSGLMASQAVRNLTTPGGNTTWSGLVSVSGAIGLGPWVGGFDLDGGSGWFSGPVNGFAGVFSGSELLLDGTILRGVVEFGMHAIDAPGSDSSHHSDAPTVTLPYVGLRIATERQLMRGRLLALGVSGFVRVDLAHKEVTGTVFQTCPFLDFDCENPQIPSSFDVGGVTFGMGVSLTFGSMR
jgi:hypothetical protein